MHIGIFAERFLGRYGADRVCVILAEMLQARGHQVTLVGVRFSRAVLERFPGQAVRIPDYSHRAPEARTLKYLRRTEYYLQRHLPEFDACVVGSFPFVRAIPYLRTLAPQVIFLDFGVVPRGGYPRQVLRLLDELTRNRRRYLRHCTDVVAISSFIAEDQSRKDCDGLVEVTPILLGADHLVSRLGYTEKDPPRREPSLALRTLERLKGEGRKLVLKLGRWEPGCYKNSQAAYDVLRSLLHYEPDAVLLVMADPLTFKPAPGLENHVACIGLPSDADLLEVTRGIDAGISVSLWEGFNLPIAELQYLEKPAFAFRLAAHPEVVVSPDQLCDGVEDMAIKLWETLRAGGRPAWAEPAVLGPWRAKFSWQRFVQDFSRVVERAA